MNQAELPRHEIVLLGVGHTNAHIVRKWGMSPIPDARLTCISNWPFATYSGMLPAVLAGQIPREDMEIDLVRLCASTGCRLLMNAVSSIDRAARRVHFHDRPPIRFDALSIGIGSNPVTPPEIQSRPGIVPIKPMQSFLDRLATACSDAERDANGLLSIVIVGGGIGGIEVALCLPGFLAEHFPDQPSAISIVTRAREVAENLSPNARRRVARALERHGIATVCGDEVTSRPNSQIETKQGRTLDASVVIWATSATPPPLLSQFDLPHDDRGFLLIDEHLHVAPDSSIFAVGDSASLAHNPPPKAGVYAVRQGPVLWENLRRTIAGRPLRKWKPQSRFLKLINTGDGRAIAEYAGLSFDTRLAKRWKDRIDGRFMRMFQDYQPMEMPEKPRSARSAEKARPRCLGCGSKVGASILDRVLQRLDIPPSPHVEQGLDQPDDAAILSIRSARTAISTDAFPAPLNDDFLNGRIAALNALSDLFAVAAKPFAALANVTLPEGSDRAREQVLFEILSGILAELKRAGATLIGGHTIEGPRCEIGLTVLGDSGPPRQQAPEPGDALIVTKPIGTGVLLAAHMQAQCPHSSYVPLLESMLTSNREASEILFENSPHAVTDITGFGLAGHLRELLAPSDLAAQIQLEGIPCLPFAREFFRQGVLSTLAPANRAIADDIEFAAALRTDPINEILFDPQTSGGLLAAIKPERLRETRSALASSNIHAQQIGVVCERHDRFVIHVNESRNPDSSAATK